MQPGRLRPARLLLLGRRHRDPWRGRRQRGADPADGDRVLQRRRHRHQHGRLPEPPHQGLGQPQRLHRQGHLLRLAQVHQLLRSSGMADEDYLFQKSYCNISAVYIVYMTAVLFPKFEHESGHGPEAEPYCS